MELFEFSLITILVTASLAMILYLFYVFLKKVDEDDKQNEPILTNFMKYKPPTIQ
jgi:maltodextrin utilization protein YvdJ